MTKEDFPDPEIPVTTDNFCFGKLTSRSFNAWVRAPFISIKLVADGLAITSSEVFMASELFIQTSHCA